MAKKDYSKSVIQCFDDLGGVNNIEYFTHCMTRMRFHLKNWNIVKEENIKNSPYSTGIKKVASTGEFQIIVGIDVDEFYKKFCEINGYDNDGATRLQPSEKDINFSLDHQKDDIQKMKNKFHIKGVFSRLLAFISKVFSPIVYPLIGYGLLLTFSSILSVEWSGKNSSASDNVHFFNQLLSILNILTDTFSLFITVAVCYTTFNAMRGNAIYGLIIGLVLTAPELTQMSSIKNASGTSMINSVDGWTLFGDGTTYPWKISFVGLIIPMIIVAYFGVWVERWVNKMKNQTAKSLLCPLLVISGPFLLGVFIAAPVGLVFTSLLSSGVNWLSTNSIAKYIGIPIIAGLYGPLVITGLHHSLTPIILQGQAVYGGTILQGFITISNVTQGAASIAFVLLHRKVTKLKELGVPNGVSAIVGGITEPSLFTVNLKYLFPLIGSSIGVFVGTLLLVASNTYALQGASSIFGILMYLQNAPDKTGVTTFIGGGYLWGTLSILLSCGVAFVMTIFLGKTKYFWAKTRKLILEDYHVDINELKIENKKRQI